MSRPVLLNDEIGRKIAEAERSGELQSAEGYGKPFKEIVGWAQTPEEFRMPFKILKNAGFVPPEVEWFHERARLRQELEAAGTEAEKVALRKSLSELEQKLSMRFESLRANGTL
jgi:hypothetical protein